MSYVMSDPSADGVCRIHAAPNSSDRYFKTASLSSLMRHAPPSAWISGISGAAAIAALIQQ
jgi:hypothetical protein